VSSSIMDLMQPEIVTVADGCSEIRFNVRPEFTIPGGVLQGGMIAVMLDMAMAVAGHGAISTASLHYDILRPVETEVVTVTARITRKGRRIVFAEAEMRNTDGLVLARGSQTAVPLR
jgi:acyl-CoA thioesterase